MWIIYVEPKPLGSIISDIIASILRIIAAIGKGVGATVGFVDLDYSIRYSIKLKEVNKNGKSSNRKRIKQEKSNPG